MWYLILALLFGQGGQSNDTSNHGHPTTQSTDGDTDSGGTTGDTSTPIPPRPPKP